MHPDVNEWGERLSALPGFEAPSAGWPKVMAARTARDARLDMRVPVALAAVVLAATALLAGGLHASRRALTEEGAGLQAAAAPVGGEARAQSAELESVLAMLPERRAMRGSTAFTIAELEDRIALVDARLSRVALEPNAPERAEALWRERVDVLQTLVQVRYADAVGTY
jgi:hypothetical protein